MFNVYYDGNGCPVVLTKAKCRQEIHGFEICIRPEISYLITLSTNPLLPNQLGNCNQEIQIRGRRNGLKVTFMTLTDFFCVLEMGI